MGDDLMCQKLLKFHQNYTNLLPFLKIFFPDRLSLKTMNYELQRKDEKFWWHEILNLSVDDSLKNFRRIG